MPQTEIAIIDKSLASWIFTKNRKLQVLLIVSAVISVFANVLPLEMQKRIVDEAINLRNYDLLILYGGIYLASFAIASGMKFLINSLQTVIGQRTVANMRKELYGHIITLPLGFYRRTQEGLVVAAMTTELATAGDFVGMAIAVPVTNLLMLGAFTGYLVWLNPLLAVVTLSVYPAVLLLIPVLQRRVNHYNKKRVDAGRRMAGKVGESVAGIHEIQANGAFAIEKRKFDVVVDRLLGIRIIWRLYRYGIKVVNSLFTNFSRFLVFSFGGYLAIEGHLELGALVAFLSAQEKLYDPWKELIQFYQAYKTSAVTYRRTLQYFDSRPEHALVPQGRDPFDLEGRIELEDVSFETEDGTRLLKGVSISLEPGEHMALVGFSGSGKSTLAQCIVQLYRYTGGRIRIGRQEVATLSKKDIVANIGFVSQMPFIFDGTVEDNLMYAWRAQYDNPNRDDEGGRHSLDRKIQVLQQSGLFVDVLYFGLNALPDIHRNRNLVAKIIRLRKLFLMEHSRALSEHIEYYDPDEFLEYSSIAENLTFGVPRRLTFAEDQLPENEIFIRFLEFTRLRQPLLKLGADIARQSLNILGNLPPATVFGQGSPIEPDEVECSQKIVTRLKNEGIEALSPAQRRVLLRFSLKYCSGRHKLVDLSAHFRGRILEARRHFRDFISSQAPQAFDFYNRSEYIATRPVLTNIFFGSLKAAGAAAQEQINQHINHLLIEEGILEDILAMGMQFQVGTKGKNLSGGQRQKLAIARILLKEPNVLVMDEATSGLDNESQSRIQNLLETQLKEKTTLLAVVHRLDIIDNYDKIAVMRAGRIVETGTYGELMEKGGVLKELVGHKD